MNDLSLTKLLLQADRFNKKVEVTGLLAYTNGRFLQTIEGPDEAIDLVFDRIKNDPQHTDIVVFIDEAIDHRCYPAWAMISSIDRGQLTINGLLCQMLSNPAAQFASGQLSAIRRTLEFLAVGAHPGQLTQQSQPED